jgi:transcriptional regulator GlxA family with amidase domain
MQAEMTAGGSALWFDLFVAMVEHLVGVSLAQSADGCGCVDEVLTGAQDDIAAAKVRR